jgi:hypothetical protein
VESICINLCPGSRALGEPVRETPATCPLSPPTKNLLYGIFAALRSEVNGCHAASNVCRPTLLFEESGSCRLPAKVRPEKVSQKNNTFKRNLIFFCGGKSALQKYVAIRMKRRAGNNPYVFMRDNCRCREKWVSS